MIAAKSDGLTWADIMIRYGATEDLLCGVYALTCNSFEVDTAET